MTPTLFVNNFSNLTNNKNSSCLNDPQVISTDVFSDIIEIEPTFQGIKLNTSQAMLIQYIDAVFMNLLGSLSLNFAS